MTNNNTNNAIEIKNLSKAFGGNIVINKLSMTIPLGETTCISGPSGCGKTTLLRLIAGLEQADSGAILFCGKSVSCKISFVFQNDRLCGDFSAVSNIRLVTGKKIPRSEIEKNLRSVGIAECTGKPVREFSGGMKRRVAIVRAVCCGADLVLMDEPFKGLDPELRKSVMDYVKMNTAGKTLICVTHDPAEAEYLGGNMLALPTPSRN